MTIASQIIEIVADILEIDVDDISIETDLTSDPNWDSLSWLTFVSSVDATLGKKVSADGVREAKTIDDLCKLIG